MDPNDLGTAWSNTNRQHGTTLLHQLLQNQESACFWARYLEKSAYGNYWQQATSLECFTLLLLAITRSRLPRISVETDLQESSLARSKSYFEATNLQTFS